MQRKINFGVIKIKKKMEPMQLSVIAISCHRLRERRPSDRNSSKHENSYSELGGPVLAPKFGKLSLEKKRSPDDVESKKNLLIKVYLRAGRGIFFKIFGDT